MAALPRSRAGRLARGGEPEPDHVRPRSAPPPHAPALGIQIANSMVPLVVHPTAEQLAHPHGLLSMFDHAGTASVGVVCDSGALDAMITATRRWGFSRLGQTGMSVIVFEAPRYAPTLMRPGDASVAPRSVSQVSLQSHGPNVAHQHG